jgi:hypothetical protein
VKNLTSITISIATIIALSGCGAKAPTPIKMSDGNDGTITASGHIGSGTSVLQNTAIMLKEASSRLEAKGYKYFSFSYIPLKYKSHGSKNPNVITNMHDLATYCYPKNDGFRVSDMNEKSSSLEDKCTAMKVEVSPMFMFIGDKEPKMSYFRWSTEQVKNDPVIDNFIKASLVDGGFSEQTITFTK